MATAGAPAALVERMRTELRPLTGAERDQALEIRDHGGRITSLRVRSPLSTEMVDGIVSLRGSAASRTDGGRPGATLAEVSPECPS